MKLLFLIPALDLGGAERQLIELIKCLDKAHFDVSLVTLYDGGKLRPEAEQIDGVKLFSLRKNGRRNIFLVLFRLWRIVREVQPHIVCGYMNLASNLCLPIGRIVGAKVVWSLRASNVDYMRYGRAMAWTFKMGAWLSRFADLIIVNSQAGKFYHVDCRYCNNHMIVIPNGIDTKRYYPAPDVGESLRVQWGVEKNENVIGLVGRLETLKDHPTFLRAAAEVARDQKNVRFVCVGNGVANYATELRNLGESLGLGERLIWTGALSDLPVVFNALDLLVSSSSSEGFSNVIGEAMACGVPCVVTDVGDSALIVGSTGDVVPPRDPMALAQVLRKWLRFSRIERQAKGLEARDRIERNFNLIIMVRKTEEAFQNVLTHSSPVGASHSGTH
jgi:glycosyltransferase involved in cell wall biosynthesis